jgi:hypothetical protein
MGGAATAVALSFILRPSEKEVALMYYFDKQYERSYESFKALYEKGDQSVSVLIPLVWSELALARVDQAIEHLRQFVKLYPDVPGAEDYLGKEFSQTFRFQDFVELMEGRDDALSPLLLRTQAKIYRYFGNQMGEKKLLEKIVDSQDVQENELYSLAYSLAKEQKWDEAIAVLNKNRAPLKGQDEKNIRLQVELLAKAKKNEQAFDLAKAYLQTHPKEELAIALAFATESPKFGLQLLHGKKTPTMIVARSALLEQEGLDFVLYEELLSALLANKLPPELYPKLFELAIQYKDKKMIKIFAQEKVQNKIDDTDFMQAAFSLPEMGGELKELLGQNYLNEHPALELLFSLGGLNGYEEEFIDSYYPIEDFSSKEKGFLARKAASSGAFNVAKKWLGQISEWEEEQKAFELALKLGMAESLQDKLTPYSSQWFLALAASGKTEPLKEGLNKKPQEEPLVLDAFWTASDLKQHETALFLSQHLLEKKLTPLHQKLKAQALISLKKGEEALAVLNELEKQGLELDPLVISALSFTERDEELKKRIDQALSKKIPIKEQKDYAYILADHKFSKEASELFLEFSKQEPEKKVEWLTQILYQEQARMIFDQISEQELEEDPMADLLLEAYIQTKEVEKFEKTIAYLIPNETRLPRLKGFSKLAEQQDLKGVREEILAKILQVDPKDQYGLEGMGLLQYHRGEVSLAKKNLLQIKNKEHQVLMALGEITENKEYYKKAVKNLREKEVTKQTDLALAASLAKLEKPRQALRIYQKYLDDKEVLADYINVLLDEECYTLASQWLHPSKYLSLEIARLRYFKMIGSMRNALFVSDYLLLTYPTKGQVFVTRADLLNGMERTREALGSLVYAMHLEPKNERLKKIYREICKPYLPKWAAEWEWRKTGSTKLEKFLRYFAEWGPVSFRIEQDRCEIDPYLNPNNGEITKDHGSPYQGEIDYRKIFCSGDLLWGRLFFGTQVLGAGTFYRLNDVWGQTDFLLEYHRPNWDFDQTTLDGGSRDLVGFLRHQKLFSRVNARLGFSFNRYNLHDFSNAATSWACDAECNIRLSRLSQPLYISLNYLFDSEYQIDSRKKGNFYPLFLINREDHAVTLFFERDWKNYFKMQLWGGGVYDRQGIGVIAPIYGADLILGRTEVVMARLHYAHSVSTDNSTEPTDSFIFRVDKEF